MQWQRVDAGNCGVEYLVEYMSGPKVIGKSSIISKEFVCEEKYINATSVRIWRFIYVKKGVSRTIELDFRNENSDSIEKSYGILQAKATQTPLKEKGKKNLFISLGKWAYQSNECKSAFL